MGNQPHNPQIDTLFRYYGISEEELPRAYEAFHYWSFAISLASSLVQFGGLTENQYNAFTKHLSKRGFNYLPYKTVASNLYNSKSNPHSSSRHSPIKHNYTNLEVINTYDLPFKSGNTYNVILKVFSDDYSVLIYNNRTYKIPKPSTLFKYNTPITILYKRTQVKGFIKSPVNAEDTNIAIEASEATKGLR